MSNSLYYLINTTKMTVVRIFDSSSEAKKHLDALTLTTKDDYVITMILNDYFK